MRISNNTRPIVVLVVGTRCEISFLVRRPLNDLKTQLKNILTAYSNT